MISDRIDRGCGDRIGSTGWIDRDCGGVSVIPVLQPVQRRYQPYTIHSSVLDSLRVFGKLVPVRIPGSIPGKRPLPWATGIAYKGGWTVKSKKLKK